MAQIRSLRIVVVKDVDAVDPRVANPERAMMVVAVRAGRREGLPARGVDRVNIRLGFIEVPVPEAALVVAQQ
jgi:hypothetical protein